MDVTNIMMIGKKVALVACCGLSVMMTVPSMAQEGETKENILTVDAQLRTRGEYQNGQGTPRSEGEKPVWLVNNRARLTVGYQRENLELKMGVQHTGMWGQDGIMEQNGRVAMNEAWAKLKFGSEKAFFAQLGRQQLSYDDERILGTVEWHPAGGWHDALRLGYEKDNHRLHAILAMNQDNTPKDHFYSGGMPYKTMQTAWYHFQQQAFGLSLLFMNTGFEVGEKGSGKTNYMQTLGTHLTYKDAGWGATGAFYYQLGNNMNDAKVSAFLASLKLNASFTSQLSGYVGYDHHSGNDVESDKWGSFNALYGSHHLFNGTMDFFGSGIALGLQDLYANLSLKASPKVNLSLTAHNFATARKAANDKKQLGQEFDLQVNWKVMKDVMLMAGYSTMFGTETMDIVKGGNHKSWQDWGWVSVNINPRVLTFKW